MKILLAQKSTYIPSWSGAIKSNRLLLEGLAARNHSCRVVSLARPELSPRAGHPVPSSSVMEVVRRGGVEVHAVPNASQFYPQLIEQIRLFKPDWILVSEDRAYLSLTGALEASPSRVVYLAHSQAMLPFGPECFQADPTKSDLLRRATKVVAASKYLQDYLLRWGRIESALVRFPVYGAAPFPRSGVFDRGSVTMINPSAIKGVAIFLELARSLPEVSFAAVPTWATRAADRAALERLPNVRLLPPAENIDEILSQARVVVVPSLWGESFGYIVVEAMLRGIPVLASNVGGLPEAKLGVDYVLPVRPIERYQERLDDLMLPVPVVPVQEIGPWREALEKLLSERDRYDRQSAASRKAALRFVADIGLASFESLLEGLVPTPEADARKVVPAREGRLDSPADGPPEYLDSLSQERLELLARLLGKKATGAPPQVGIPRLPRDCELNSFPLSFGQQRLWFLDQLEPGLPVYNTQNCLQLMGPLKRDILERSLNEIVGRHEAWRCTFPAVDGQPVQVITPARRFPLPLVDLRDHPQPARAAEVQRLAVEEARRPVDLARGPLLQMVLLQIGDEEHVLILTVHHIVSDAWSMGVFRRELETLYRAFSEGRPSPLPELPIQYADFAHWQRQWLQGERLADLLAYWRRQLTGPLPVLNLLTDHPRPSVPRYRGSLQSVVPPPALFEALDALCRREGVTLFMALLAAFQVLLHRYTGQEDILVGSPVAGRTRLETEPMIGFFVNTLVLRGDLSGNPTFREFLARVREVALGAYAHQDLPFEKLVEDLNLPRSGSRNPLFEVMFVLQNVPAPLPDLPGLAVNLLLFDAGKAIFDLTLTLVRRATGITVQCEYNTDLFGAATITRMLGHFLTLLEGIVAEPGLPVSELTLLTEAERRQLVSSGNGTQSDYPQACIHQVFEAQAERTPEAIAVVSGCEEYTYRELNRRANHLAHHLQALGVGPDVLVGLLLGRSVEAVVGLLGILKAGGAYVPLDPTYPGERLRFLAEDARLAVVVTQRRFQALVPGLAAKVVCLDAKGSVIGPHVEVNPVNATTPDHLAYVMYTSGSTGTPKGLAIPHRGVVRLVKGVGYADLTAGEVFLQAAPLSFDASTFEVWGCLLNGARLVIFPGRIPLPEELAEALKRYQVTTLWLSAGLFHQFVEHHLEGLRPVRQLLAGGDVLSVPHVQKVLRELPGCRLINGYGPTEGTTFSCCHPVGDPDQLGASVPIGRPIANTRVYVLDRHLEPLPVGVPGELYIGGDGLARGYHNRPELTAERFIPDPLSGIPGTRLYKTGDRARFLPDGTLEFLGRLDHQVKIRGFRIEPAEVEAVLNQHPAVRESAVVVREETPGDKRLVAFVALQPGQPDAVGLDILSFAGQKLPPYMLPAAFIRTDTLPLTRQGKVDRRLLQTAQVTWPPPAAGYVPAADPLQWMFVQVWEELLGVRPIGIRDNFFERGGHSLLAVAMVARIEQLCGRKLPLAALFAGATIEHLSQVLLKPVGNQPESPLLKVQTGGLQRPFFFLHGDLGGDGLYCRNLARHLGMDQPFYGIHPHGLAGQSLPSTIEAMAAEHLEMVRTVQPEGPYLLGGFCNGALEAFEMAQQLSAQGQLVALLVLIAPPRPRGALRNLVIDTGPSLPPARPQGPPTLGDLRTLAPYAQRQAILGFCAQACASYFPRLYGGRVTIFQPVEDLKGTQEPSQGWKDLADMVEMHLIPGGHESSITRHVQTVAEQLRCCLSKAQQG